MRKVRVIKMKWGLLSFFLVVVPVVAAGKLGQIADPSAISGLKGLTNMPTTEILLGKSTHLTLGLAFVLFSATWTFFNMLSRIKEKLAVHDSRLENIEGPVRSLPKEINEVKTCLARIEGHLRIGCQSHGEELET